MSGVKLFIGLIVATLGWQIIAQTVGPPLAKWFYRKRVANLQRSGLSFESDAAMHAWVEKTMTMSMNVSLLLLATACGAIAGMLAFPLIGFSRSLNGWSWLRIIVLCVVSWIVADALYPGAF